MNRGVPRHLRRPGPARRAGERLRTAAVRLIPADCHCLCGDIHPGSDCCDGRAVTLLLLRSAAAGLIRVPLCGGCAAALDSLTLASG